jgi:ubiquinone/menaquinone biosynthesis C-methylase UbiE
VSVDAHKAGVIRFYETHPINEEEILAKLEARGADLGTLAEEDFRDLDQDHYGGIPVLEALVELAGIGPEHHVLDVCSGMGGPARWVAHHLGARVTGLDFTASRVESARRLTDRVGLSDRVDFVHGDATDMPFPDAVFDVVISQESWLHVPDKAAVIASCARVLRPGGTIAFTDVVLRGHLTQDESDRLAAEMHAPGIAPVQRYLNLLAEHGCAVASCEDLSEPWTGVLVDRLAMFRSLADTTTAKFGEAHFRSWDRTYAFFVGLFVTGVLGGARIVARRSLRAD